MLRGPLLQELPAVIGMLPDELLAWVLMKPSGVDGVVDNELWCLLPRIGDPLGDQMSSRRPGVPASRVLNLVGVLSLVNCRAQQVLEALEDADVAG